MSSDSADNNHSTTLEGISTEFIQITQGYVRLNYDCHITPDVINLIILFYAKPLVMKVQYWLLRKTIKYCPIKGTWNSMIKEIDTIMNISRSGYRKKETILRYDNKRINESDWNQFRWDEEKIIKVTSSWEKEISQSDEEWRERNQRRPTPPPGWKSWNGPNS